MIEIKSDSAVEGMREAGRVVANALAAVRREAAIGVSLGELDEVAHDVLRKAGARSPFLNYHPSFAPTPFPAVICASVNDVIVHGIPDGYRLADGDLLSIDFGAELDGWTGDAATSFVVGTPSPADEQLIEATEKALAAGIAAAAEGARIGDISHAIGTLARGAGYGVPAGFACAERGQAGARDAAAGRPGPGDRAHADGRRWQRLPDRARRMVAQDGRRHPGGARRAHRRHHQGRPAHPDAALGRWLVLSGLLGRWPRRGRCVCAGVAAGRQSAVCVCCAMARGDKPERISAKE